MSKSDNSILKDFNPYSPEYIPLFEALYGKNLISLGGLASIDAMFDSIDLYHLNALDLGFGLGGISYYIAEKFQANIYGVELYQWMADYTNTHLPCHLKNQLQFKTYDQNGQIPYENNFFDIVFSKGVLNHVKNKSALFQEIFLKLKAGGKFVIADWIVSGENTSMAGPIVSETKESYMAILKQSMFTDIDITNQKQRYQQYISEFLNNLDQKKTFIIETFGEALFIELLNQHVALARDVADEIKIPIRIIACKS